MPGGGQTTTRHPPARYCCSHVIQTATDFADASHSKSAKSAATTISYGIFSSENAYPCTVTQQHLSALLIRPHIADRTSSYASVGAAVSFFSAAASAFGALFSAFLFLPRLSRREP